MAGGAASAAPKARKATSASGVNKICLSLFISNSSASLFDDAALWII
jgi:hypothetical protein